MEKKFVTFRCYDGSEFIIVFPAKAQHRDFAAAVERSTFGGCTPISGGFVANGECYGKSISLGMKSRPEDTELLKSITD